MVLLLPRHLPLLLASTFLSRAVSVSAFTPTNLSCASSINQKTGVPISNSVMGASSQNNANGGEGRIYPELLVLDLDACTWDQEMYQMPALPSSTVKGDLNGRGEGAIGVMSGPHKISLHKGSLVGLQEHADGKYGSMKIAFASSADTPFAEKIGRASLKMLEVLPGLTVWDLVVGRDWNGQDVNQIGRQPPLNSNKAATHFPRLREITGIRYDRMLFFDDCNWGDHCGNVQKRCKETDTKTGPAIMRTPSGIRESDWRKGLENYVAQALRL